MKEQLEELQICLDMLGQFWSDLKNSGGTDVPTYELSEAICRLAHLIKEVEK